MQAGDQRRNTVAFSVNSPCSQVAYISLGLKAQKFMHTKLPMQISTNVPIFKGNLTDLLCITCTCTYYYKIVLLF